METPESKPETSRQPTGDPLVFASGGDGRKRIVLGAIGVMMLVLAWLVFLFVQADLIRVLGGVLAVIGAGLLLWVIWKRGRAFEVRAEGIRVFDGGSMFGETNLTPWESVSWFGAKSAGKDRVKLVFQKTHSKRIRRLPGAGMSVEEYDHAIDRLRVVLGNRYRNLRLGGVV